MFNQTKMEKMLPKPELMFLSLSVTTFYRKSFTFESQVSVFKRPQSNLVFIPGTAHTVLSAWISRLENRPWLLPGPPPAGAGPDVSGSHRESQQLWHPGCCQQRDDVRGPRVPGHKGDFLPLAGDNLPLSRAAHEVNSDNKTSVKYSPHWPRRPAQLKECLRPLRVSLGPVSILLSLAAASRQLSLWTWTWSLTSPIQLASSLLVQVSASLAGIIFRYWSRVVRMHTSYIILWFCSDLTTLLWSTSSSRLLVSH